jgi:hypothetical protein
MISIILSCRTDICCGGMFCIGCGCQNGCENMHDPKNGAVLQVLAKGSGMHSIGLLACTFVYTTATLGGGIAMTPGGLGVSEAGMILLLGHLGVGSSAAASHALPVLTRETTKK